MVLKLGKNENLIILILINVHADNYILYNGQHNMFGIRIEYVPEIG